MDAEEHAAWRVASAGDAGAVEAFLKAHPSGHYAGDAKARLAALRAPAPSAPAIAQPAVGIYPQARKPGEVFRDCADCPEMVVIPPGEFLMGSPPDEKGRDNDEGPQHRVRIGEAFAVGKYEVTVGEYRRFVRESGHRSGNSCWTYDGGEWKDRSGRDWESPGFRQSDQEPVVCVNWEDAQAYVRWLSGKTGEEYRLLSEAEWEYAARAGTTARFPWGEDSGQSRICGYANGAGTETSFEWRNKACRDGYERTSPGGVFPANGFGLHDMHGNVWEWVSDCWNESYAGAPRDGSAWLSGECSRRVLRGGSWNLSPRYLRSANRFRIGTGDRLSSGGFRVARTL